MWRESSPAWWRTSCRRPMPQLDPTQTGWIVMPEWAALAQATGIVLGRFDCGVVRAEQLFVFAARTNGIPVLRLAEALIGVGTRERALAAVAAADGPASR